MLLVKDVLVRYVIRNWIEHFDGIQNFPDYKDCTIALPKRATDQFYQDLADFGK